jgi:hypothetical protein
VAYGLPLSPSSLSSPAAVVGAGSVVTHNVESFTVVAGNPARLIRRLKPAAGPLNPAEAAAAAAEAEAEVAAKAARVASNVGST